MLNAGIIIAVIVVSFGAIAFATHNNLISGVDLDEYPNIIILNQDQDSLVFASNATNAKKAIRTFDTEGRILSSINTNGAMTTQVMYINQSIAITDQTTGASHWIILKNHTLYLKHPNGEINILNPVRCAANEVC